MSIPEPGTPNAEQPAEVRVPVVFRLPAKKPYSTYVLLGFTLLVFVLQLVFRSFLTNGYDWPFLIGGKINEFILRGELWRLITPVFLHANLTHILFNMYALYTIGSSLERMYGHKRFLALYFVSAYAGNALSFLLSDAASLGASTAVFGLVVAEAVLIYRNKRMFGNRAQSMLINLGLVIAFNLFLGFSAGLGIDNWGHLGGLLGGFGFAWAAGPRYKIQPLEEGGYEFKDTINREKLIWGFLLSAGLFSAVVIGKFLSV